MLFSAYMGQITISPLSNDDYKIKANITVGVHNGYAEKRGKNYRTDWIWFTFLERYSLRACNCIKFEFSTFNYHFW